VEHLDEGDHVIHDDVGAQDTQGLDADSPAMMNSPILQPTQPMVVNRLVRVQKPVRRLIKECNMSFALSCAEEVDCGVELSTYTKAIVFGDRGNWVVAVQEEMKSFEKNGTWDIVQLPAEKKAVHCK
jgi:hypothetical protein